MIAINFGLSSDRPVRGDYTGDGKADIAFWRPTTGEWFVLRSEDSTFYSFPFGASTDVPSPGDYDGDGRFDAAVFRPANSTWYIKERHPEP
ncbi:MAG: VCBS repeat-containing protein [Acidobacteria bacterium]|nr:VCBS repeat-containing protein [Acidobacteriota bacterium]